MCKTVLLAGLVVLCAGLMQAEEAESGDIIVAKIRLVTPHYEYEWTADAEAAALADAEAAAVATPGSSLPPCSADRAPAGAGNDTCGI